MDIEKCYSMIPLKLYGDIPIGVGRDCFILIFFRAKLNKYLDNIKIKDVDKKLIGLNRFSYYNGIKILEKCGLITVTKNHGRAYLISLNKKKLDENTVSYILGGKVKK